jgi:hypothetical protein
MSYKEVKIIHFHDLLRIAFTCPDNMSARIECACVSLLRMELTAFKVPTKQRVPVKWKTSLMKHLHRNFIL